MIQERSRKVVHWITGPAGHRPLRTACGRSKLSRVSFARKRAEVTCASCLRMPADWRGLEGYNFDHAAAERSRP